MIEVNLYTQTLNEQALTPSFFLSYPHFFDFFKNYARKLRQRNETSLLITGLNERKSVFEAVFDHILAQACEKTTFELFTLIGILSILR